jgi:curved DNA-binding protein CbpA
MAAAERMTFYDILNVHTDATGEDIRVAYRRLAIAMHPDRNPDPRAEEAMRMVNEAWTTLSDPEKRRVYDAQLFGYPLGTQTPHNHAQFGEDDDFLPTMHRLRVPITAIILVLLLVIFVFSAYAPKR